MQRAELFERERLPPTASLKFPCPRGGEVHITGRGRAHSRLGARRQRQQHQYQAAAGAAQAGGRAAAAAWVHGEEMPWVLGGEIFNIQRVARWIADTRVPWYSSTMRYPADMVV